jgi:hypothetical protein
MGRISASTDPSRASASSTPLIWPKFETAISSVFPTREHQSRVLRQKNRSPSSLSCSAIHHTTLGQENENDQNNANSKYQALGQPHSRTTYIAGFSRQRCATNSQFERPIRHTGVPVGIRPNPQTAASFAYVTNSKLHGPVSQLRRNASPPSCEDFSRRLYIIDLGGNIRQNPKLSGTTHNVFGIQVGVSHQSILVKRRSLTRR